MSRISQAISSVLLACITTAGASAQCTFAMGTTSTVSPFLSQPRGVVAADFNGDGRLDVVTAASGMLVFAQGNGDGTFGTNINSSVALGNILGIVAIDFNSDGRMDIVGASASSNMIVVLAGNGAGSFTLVANYPSFSGPSAIALGDYDNDARQDIFWVNFGSGTFGGLRNLGGGNFAQLPLQSTGSMSAGPQGLALADFTGDGNLDIAVANQSATNVTVFMGNGAGGFTQYDTLNAGISPAAIAAADLNGDGRPDIACANFNGGTLSWSFSTGPGFGAFAATSSVGSYRGICIADVNSDGRPDLIGTAASPSVTNVYLGLGGGTFGAANTLVNMGSGPWGIAPADFNSDGRIDLAVGFNVSNTTNAYINTSNTPPVISSHPVGISVIDGSPASFTVIASGPGIGYQWRRNYVNLTNGGAISGATSPTLTLAPTAMADNLSLYDCVITNTCSSITSRMAALSVLQCPADFNGDGEVDFFDYLDFVDGYSSGC